MPYICTKFHEEFLNCFKVIEWADMGHTTLLYKINKRAKMALYRLPDYHTSLSQLAFRFTRKSSMLIFKMAAILDFQSEPF